MTDTDRPVGETAPCGCTLVEREVWHGNMGGPATCERKLVWTPGADPRAIGLTEPMPRLAWRREEYGAVITFDGSGGVRESDVIVMLRADAANVLKPGSRYEIRKTLPQAVKPGENGLCWYRCEDPLNSERTDDQPEGEAPGPKEGYILVGQFRTPSYATYVPKTREPVAAVPEQNT